MKFFKDHVDLANVRVTPVLASLEGRSNPQHAIGRISGLIDELERLSGISRKGALAVWQVESGGHPFLPGKPVLRFEVHKFWQHWGSENATVFDRHFQFGGHEGTDGNSWQNHKWRRTISDGWRKIHIGNQDSEYEAFDFAARLGGLENACLSSSFGGPQILGSNHAVIGYPNASALFEAFGESERWQVLGFFDFVQAKELVGVLAAENWLAFAKVYNGEGNAAVYAERIKAAYDGLISYDNALDTNEDAIAVFHVSPGTALALNLREKPKPAAIIAVLNQAQNVQKIGEDEEKPDWWKVKAYVSGEPVSGYINKHFLAPNAASTVALPPVGVITSTRLCPKEAARTSALHRITPLHEATMPSRNGANAETKAKEIFAISQFLDPCNPEHIRYQPRGGGVRNSTYAYDFCELAGVYLPRVWWTEPALAAVRRGETLPVRYGETVREMTVNALHDWLLDYGAAFGWQRLFDLDALQGAANNGDVCMIVAQCRDLDRPGHIVMIIPEGQGLKAARKHGKITQPVESQAGQVNFAAKTQLIQWWRNPLRFRSFGFWRHA